MHKAVTVRDAPALRDEIQRLHRAAWPAFLDDAGVNRRWPALYTTFPECQFVLRDDAGVVISAGNAIPVAWDGTREGLPASIAEVLERALAGPAPTVLCALAAIVSPAHRGEGLSREIVETMRGIAARHGFGALIAPVRPTRKAQYPLTPMERYVTWTRPDGAPFDPWLRVHWRLGAEILKVAPEAMVTGGTVAEWEAWTGMRFPESGAYVVPGALQPVVIDREGDRGRLRRPQRLDAPPQRLRACERNRSASPPALRMASPPPGGHRRDGTARGPQAGGVPAIRSGGVGGGGGFA